jgi:cbb3-type cytochrome oxidase cytochrome c subunit
MCVACSRSTSLAPSQARLAPPTAQAAPTEPTRPVATLRGDARRGRELVQRFECNRCHEGTGLADAPLEKNCFSCHEQIAQGTFKVSAQALARFRPHILDARDAPSLTAAGARLQASWLRDYLLSPRDLRPKLLPTMPRLALSPEQASDIAAYLTAGAAPGVAFSPSEGNPNHGRELMAQKACAGCHAFSGVPTFDSGEAAPAESELSRSAALAPDLRFTRERFRRDELLGWLLDPKGIKPDTRMPNFDLSVDEARDIAAYILGAELAPEQTSAFVRLPVLARRVSFDEVNGRVFSRTCHHCHTDADAAGGDGGPGNTGGFGFAPRGVSFSSHASILAGYLDANGRRRSLFEPLADGTPRLVAALLARHAEARQAPNEAVRGMPLGLPALSAEDIQLVETWVVEGKPL